MLGEKQEIKVLLVDDEQAFIDTLARRLQLRGLKVETVYDGEQALSALKESKPDVMVLDLKMPGMGGLDVLREIEKSHLDLQVIILTGHGGDKDADEAKRLGSFDFLKKPTDIETLLGRIRDAFAEKVERSMTAPALAEEGDVDRAKGIISKRDEQEEGP